LIDEYLGVAQSQTIFTDFTIIAQNTDLPMTHPYQRLSKTQKCLLVTVMLLLQLEITEGRKVRKNVYRCT